MNITPYKYAQSAKNKIGMGSPTTGATLLKKNC